MANDNDKKQIGEPEDINPESSLRDTEKNDENKDNENEHHGSNNKEKKKKDVKFPIVGIGASAGGLAAFEAFFSGMPDDRDSGMAFVLVQHLAPDHESMLRDLISRYTRMEVLQVKDGMEVQRNCIYIIPPNKDMSFFKSKLLLMEPTAPRGQRLPIDFFFRSLARDQKEHAIGIVLSGTGSDGTLGIRAIKGEGGMVMVQNSASAEYDGMPRSAMGTGMVDYELPPAEMPDQLMSFIAQVYKKTKSSHVLVPETENMLDKIFVLLHSQTGHDFSQYKPNTINRRIERRMAVNQIQDMEQYIKFLKQESGEVQALFKDLLIGVTSFFRDPEAFHVFKTECLPKLFKNHPSNTMIRMWVAGCSTGEEAYSMAIIMDEYMEEHKIKDPVQIFATDIDKTAIETARAGIYPASIAADVSEERLSKYFEEDSRKNEKTPESYKIRKKIRDMLIFSEHNVIKDPPFSKQDVISCRNLLIYMNSELQKKVISLFHYGLKPGGYLFLGSSETVGELGELFTNIDRKAKIYKRREGPQSISWAKASRMLDPKKSVDKNQSSPAKSKNSTKEKEPLKEIVEQELLKHLEGAGILVNEDGDILYIHGRSGRFLEPTPGAFDRNVKKMVREGLKNPLITALYKSINTKTLSKDMGLKIQSEGNPIFVDLTVRPITMSTNLSNDDVLYLIVVEDSDLKEKVDISDLDAKSEDDPRVEALLRELQEKEEYLQATNEELETSNEELKSSNEEMQSVNEELQSTNEELETSKEELQSVNEELSTVNAELQAKVSDLSRANNDMNNLLAGTGIATVFVDHDLNIMRFTPTATRIINLIRSDVGRPVGHIVSNLQNYDTLVEDTKEVLDTLIPKEVEVKTKEGKLYKMHIQPYRTLENVIEGAVLTFANIEGAGISLQEPTSGEKKAYDKEEVEINDDGEKQTKPGKKRQTKDAKSSGE